MKNRKKVEIFLYVIIVICLIGIISIISIMLMKEKQQETHTEEEQTRVQSVQLDVYLDSDMSNEEIKSIGKEIEKIDGVIKYDYITGEELWEQYKKEYFGGNESLAEGFKDDNPLADSAHYEVKISEDKMNDAEESIQQIEGVRKITRG